MLKPFQWFGSKTYMLKYILGFIPSHDYYAELFGGAAVVLLNKPIANVEIYNDKDHMVYNFWKVINTSEKYDKFLQGLSNLIYHEDLIEEYYALLNSEDDVEKALGFYILAYAARNGVMHPDSFSFRRAYTRNIARLIFVKKPKQLDDIIKRMQNVQFINQSWQHVWDKISIKPAWQENGFVYLDPPYPHNTRTNDKDYNVEMSYEEHEELIDKIKDTKVKVLLSSYPNELYDTLLDYGWKKHEFVVKSRTGYKPDTQTMIERTEVLYYNYELPQRDNTLFDN
jgi:DNA adenine methylase